MRARDEYLNFRAINKKATESSQKKDIFLERLKEWSPKEETDPGWRAKPFLPCEHRCHGEYDAGGDGGEDADAARGVEVAGVQHEDPGQEEELRGEEGGQPDVTPVP